MMTCQYVTSHLHQLSLAIFLWVNAVNTGESWGVNGHATLYASPVSLV